MRLITGIIVFISLAAVVQDTKGDNCGKVGAFCMTDNNPDPTQCCSRQCRMSERYMINRSFNTEDGTGELETRMEAIRYYCAPSNILEFVNVNQEQEQSQKMRAEEIKNIICSNA